MITFLFSPPKSNWSPVFVHFISTPSLTPDFPPCHFTSLFYSLITACGTTTWLPSPLGRWSGSLARLPVSLSFRPSVPFTHRQLNCPHLHLICIPTLWPHTTLLQIIVCSFISAFDHLLLRNLLFVLINAILAPFLLNAKLTKNPGSFIRGIWCLWKLNCL